MGDSGCARTNGDNNGDAMGDGNSSGVAEGLVVDDAEENDRVGVSDSFSAWTRDCGLACRGSVKDPRMLGKRGGVRKPPPSLSPADAFTTPQGRDDALRPAPAAAKRARGVRVLGVVHEMTSSKSSTPVMASNCRLRQGRARVCCTASGCHRRPTRRRWDAYTGGGTNLSGLHGATNAAATDAATCVRVCCTSCSTVSVDVRTGTVAAMCRRYPNACEPSLRRGDGREGSLRTRWTSTTTVSPLNVTGDLG